ncbi:MAG: hypothetical protein V4501_05090 [Pseudomonadota bacterium]
MSSNDKVYSEAKLISVFFRYVQWSLAIGTDNRIKLAEFVVSYLKNATVSKKNKEYVKNKIKFEKEKFDSKNWGVENPMLVLFDNHPEMVQLVG